MAWINKDLGPVTAYAYAVAHGYSGTEEEFAEMIAALPGYAQMGEEAAASAHAAAEAAEAATEANTNAQEALDQIEEITDYEGYTARVQEMIDAQDGQIAAQDAAIDVLEARMDGFTNLPSGSTAGDAELQDIRVKADGSVSGSAGTAVREQITELKNDLDAIEPGLLSEDARAVLLDCFKHIEWVDDDGNTYINTLKNALGLSDRDPDLPDAYDQVEYIESTGTQYIQTNILTQIPMRVIVSVIISSSSQPTIVGGGVSSNSNSRFFIVARPYDYGADHIGNRFANDTVTWTENGNTYTGGWLNIRSFDASKTKKYDIVSGIEYSNVSGKVKTYVECDGYSIEGVRNIPDVGYPIYFFYQSNADTVDSGRLYACQFYTSNNTLIFKAVPCVRKSDSIAGIYDTVNGVFYTNSGTGTFEIGAIIE